MICDICPHGCDLGEGETGRCGVLSCFEDRMKNEREGQCSILAIESVEKKPFFHFTPGTKCLSVGMLGCSLTCSFCLPGDTLIKTPNGTKRMDQIRDGDAIISFDDSHSVQQLVSARVGHVVDREAEELIELEVDGRTIQLTPEHPVLTKNRGWVEAKDLTTDDEVLCDKTD